MYFYSTIPLHLLVTPIYHNFWMRNSDSWEKFLKNFSKFEILKFQSLGWNITLTFYIMKMRDRKRIKLIALLSFYDIHCCISQCFFFVEVYTDSLGKVLQLWLMSYTLVGQNFSKNQKPTSELVCTWWNCAIKLLIQRIFYYTVILYY